MLKRHKKHVKDYFSDVTIWSRGIVIFVLVMAAIFAMLIITEGVGDISDMVKPIVTILVFLYALYGGRHILAFKRKCMNDLKNGAIVTKTVTVTKFGVDGKHNLAMFRRKLVGRIKYAFVDEAGEVYYLLRAKKKMVPDDAIEGRAISVTYLENTRLVLEINLDLRDDIDQSLDNFKNAFPHYFERTYD